MNKAGKFLAVLLFVSITFHMYYDVAVQLNTALDGKKTELPGNCYSLKSIQLGLNLYISHAHDFVIHNSFSYCTRSNEFATNQFFAQSFFLSVASSSFWHPPQS
jgi:hypothetical protein